MLDAGGSTSVILHRVRRCFRAGTLADDHRRARRFNQHDLSFGGCLKWILLTTETCRESLLETIISPRSDQANTDRQPPRAKSST